MFLETEKFPYARSAKLNQNRIGFKETSADDANSAADVFWPVIQALKYFGHCPLSYVHVEERGLDPDKGVVRIKYRKFKLVWKSFCFLWTLLVGLAYCFSWGTFFIGLVHGRTFKNVIYLSQQNLQTYVSSQGSVNQAIKATFFAVPLIQFMEVVMSWLESKGLGEFLNNYHEIQKDFHTCFPLYKSGRMGVTKVRNRFLLFYVIFPSVVSFFMTSFLTPGVFASFANDIWSFLYLIHVTAVSLLEDVKVILTYYLLGESFREIKNGIVYCTKREELTAEKVKSWRALVHSVRVQANLAGNWQKVHQLMLFVGSIILVTSSAFLVVSLNGGDRVGFIVLGSSSYIIMIGGRIYLKIYAASLISYEESMIARALVFINVPQDQFALQMEIKFLHDMIKQKPCFINFGSYVTLNKRLILGMASQVVTYLIVLMQFSQT